MFLIVVGVLVGGMAGGVILGWLARSLAEQTWAELQALERAEFVDGAERWPEFYGQEPAA